jgi:hypothetical protein
MLSDIIRADVLFNMLCDGFASVRVIDDLDIVNDEWLLLANGAGRCRTLGWGRALSRRLLLLRRLLLPTSLGSALQEFFDVPCHVGDPKVK